MSKRRSRKSKTRKHTQKGSETGVLRKTDSSLAATKAPDQVATERVSLPSFLANKLIRNLIQLLVSFLLLATLASAERIKEIVSNDPFLSQYSNFIFLVFASIWLSQTISFVRLSYLALQIGLLHLDSARKSPLSRTQDLAFQKRINDLLESGYKINRLTSIVSFIGIVFAITVYLSSINFQNSISSFLARTFTSLSSAANQFLSTTIFFFAPITIGLFIKEIVIGVLGSFVYDLLKKLSTLFRKK